MRAIHKYSLAILNWFYPKKCFLCQSALSYLDFNHICNDCLWDIKRLKLSHDTFIYSYGPFEGPLRELIHTFKYNGFDYLSWELAKLLFSVWQENPDLKNCDRIIPVPLHNTNLRERGYNQSQLLAKDLLRHIQEFELKKNLQLLENELVRSKNTTSQTHLTKEQRYENIKGAFRLNHPPSIHEKTVLLIDDVYTTGATLQASREVLLENGARKVLALTLARD